MDRENKKKAYCFLLDQTGLIETVIDAERILRYLHINYINHRIRYRTKHATTKVTPMCKTFREYIDRFGRSYMVHEVDISDKDNPERMSANKLIELAEKIGLNLDE